MHFRVSICALQPVLCCASNSLYLPSPALPRRACDSVSNMSFRFTKEVVPCVLLSGLLHGPRLEGVESEAEATQSCPPLTSEVSPPGVCPHVRLACRQSVLQPSFSPGWSHLSEFWKICWVLNKNCASTAESPAMLTYQMLKGFLNIQPSLTLQSVPF